MNESLCPLSPSVCGFYYFTLETVGFQSRLVFHQWIWDPGMTDFDFMNGGMVFFEDLCYFRVEVMKFHFGGIHGEDISGFLLATQNHHEWRIGNVRFSFNTAIWLISLDEGYDSEDIMFTVMNSMVWCSQKAKQEPKAESFVVLSKHNEDIHIAYVDMGSTSYYFAKEIFEHNLEMEFEIWCLKANGQNFATLFDCDGVVLNTNERHFLLVGAKWRILEWKVMKILLYQCQSKSISMPWIFTVKHVISCSGSVWGGMRCNRWIASNDLLTEKRRLLTTVESHKYDHIRPRAKWRKASESAYPTNALGSIVLLLSLFKVRINNMVMVTYVSCNLLH